MTASLRHLAIPFLASIFSCFAHVSSAHAQEERPSKLGSVEIPNSQRFRFPSRTNNETYLVDIAPVISPIVPPSTDRPMPVVFVLDGNVHFGGIVSTVTNLSLGQLPSLLIVGIGYPMDGTLPAAQGVGVYMANRNRDLTPTYDSAWHEQITNTFPLTMGMPYPESGAPGGADELLTFINDELKPFVSSMFPNADVNDNAIVGHSLGGLFVMHTLFSAPGSFDRYVAGSPSLWWDDGFVISEEETFEDPGTHLFMSYGSLEPDEQALAPGTAMDVQLRDRADRFGLRYTFHIFEGESHESVIPATFSRGLLDVFDAPQFPIPTTQ